MAEVRQVHPEPVAELPAEADPVRRRRWLRLLLLGVVPVLIAAGGLYVWVHAGRYVETDNAYVKADTAHIAPEISGTVVAVPVGDNDHVAAGDALFRIDERPWALAVTKAKAALTRARTDILRTREDYSEALAGIELARSRLEFAKVQLARQQSLAQAGIGRTEDLDAAEFDWRRAEREVDVAQRHAAALLTAIGGDPDAPLDSHPAVAEALAVLRQAELDLERTVVRAPFAGVVSQTPSVGDFVQRGRPALSLIAADAAWVEANLKETELTYVRPGQPVEVTVDSYPQYRWTGTVQSISSATGAEFALLPPQNATGNWVKVVQRLPVRVQLDDGPADLPLRAGMSVVVTIDTGHRRHLGDLFPHAAAATR